jgi:amidase
MKRRDFISTSSIAAVGITSILNISCKNDAKDLNHKMTEEKDDFELNELTVDQLQEKMKTGVYTSEQITNLYLKRIEAIDKNGPKLNAVIEVNPDALSIAKAMDRERKEGKIRSALHGIPILIKDNIDTADKMMTTAGSLALLNHQAKEDAFIVQQLRAAGAVLLGKTNLSEWANFRSTKSCSGWSSRGGQTKNPFILDHNPCGSSSGSGVAVSANLCAVAIGTETDGSITCPAAVSGAVGIKPTVGLVSRSGIIPISSTQDTAGPITRTVTDAAIVLSAITGIDSLDEKTKESNGKVEKDYTKFLKIDGLKGKRIGMEKKKYDNQFLEALFEKTIEVLKNSGATIVDMEYLEEINKLGDAEYEVLKFEFKDGLNKYFAKSNTPIKTIDDVIAFNKKNENEAMPTFKQEILEASAKMKGLDSKEYQEALNKSHEGSKKMIDDILKANNLDAICGLTMGPACSIDTIYGDRWGEVFLTAPAAMSGYPHITVPAGKVYDLPVGLSFFSTAYQEPKLLEIAFAFEQATKHRTKPNFKPSFLA